MLHQHGTNFIEHLSEVQIQTSAMQTEKLMCTTHKPIRCGMEIDTLKC